LNRTVNTALFALIGPEHTRIAAAGTTPPVYISEVHPSESCTAGRAGRVGINAAELALVVAIVFVAAFMARGVWMF